MRCCGEEAALVADVAAWLLIPTLRQHLVVSMVLWCDDTGRRDPLLRQHIRGLVAVPARVLDRGPGGCLAWLRVLEPRTQRGVGGCGVPKGGGGGPGDYGTGRTQEWGGGGDSAGSRVSS